MRENLTNEGRRLKSLINGKSWIYGEWETPNLDELRARVRLRRMPAGKTSVREMVADVQTLHSDPGHAGALFQAASQFNCLEMASPAVTPEQGVGIYENDPTQGPACAISAGAGTIYRNYFAPVNGRVGQSADNQIDCLADLGAALGNAGGRLWDMKNGYALATHEGLTEIRERLRSSKESERDELRRLLRIGIQRDTEVTLDGCGHRVTQVYGSALPVAYTPHVKDLWEEFARLVLEASYEATICAAILNTERTGNPCVFLTLLGGGVFGNSADWIVEALRRALGLYKNADLDVAVVSYGVSDPRLSRLLEAERC
ncbi:MAG: hypothetical protein SCM96_15355 [Acidobacteriota bacterium]|nr:hypothetical protein [Acidobacteriota bacterium]